MFIFEKLLVESFELENNLASKQLNVVCLWSNSRVLAQIMGIVEVVLKGEDNDETVRELRKRLALVL